MALTINTINVGGIDKEIEDTVARNNSESAVEDVRELDSRVTGLNARVDAIVAPTGEAPNPDEILDARHGANGITYVSLGNAIRGQISELITSLGNFNSNDTYSSFSELPTNTLAGFTKAAANGMSDKPITFSAGVLVETISPITLNESGGIQRITDWTGCPIAIRAYVNQVWGQWQIIQKSIVRNNYYTNNNKYSKFSSLPENSFTAFSTSAANGMSDKPITFTSGIFVETLSPVVETESGGIQRITDWSGDVVAVRAYVDGSWRSWQYIRGTRLLGNVTSNTYASFSALPVNSFVSFNSSTANAMSDKPINFTTGVFVETLSPLSGSEIGGIQRVTDWYGSVVAVRAYVDNAWRPWQHIRGNKLLGNFTDNVTYKSFSALPVNSFAGFTSIAANAMTDRPANFTTGVFVETLSPIAETESGGIQRITNWYGDVVAVRAYVDQAWTKWQHIRGTKLLGNISDNTLYKSFSALPPNSFIGITSAAANTMADRPANFTTGVFVETLSPIVENESGGLQRVTNWYGDVVAIRSYVNQEWTKWQHVRSTKLLGNISDNNTYSAFSALPPNSFVGISSSAANAMTDAIPIKFTTGIFVETLSPIVENESGGIQRATDWNGDIVAVRAYVDHVWRPWTFIKNERGFNITVGVGKDYTSLAQALKYMQYNWTKHTKYNLYIDAGTYDITNEVVEMINQNQIGNKGLHIMPNTTIYGAGKDKTKIIINYLGTNDDIRSNLSGLNVPYTCSISGVTVEVYRVRYAIHSDTKHDSSIPSDFYENGTINLKNVKLVHKGHGGSEPSYYAPSAWGGGSWGGQTRTFEDCDFIASESSGFLNHNHDQEVGQTHFNFKFCNFLNSRTGEAAFHRLSGCSLISWGGNGELVANFTGCHTNKYIGVYPNTAYDEEASCNYMIYADNEIPIFESAVNDAYKKFSFISGGCEVAFANGDIQAYRPVVVDEDGTNCKQGGPATGFKRNGVAVCRASSGDKCSVMLKGVLYAMFLGLPSLTVGKKYNYSSGSWVETTDDHALITVITDKIAAVNL